MPEQTFKMETNKGQTVQFEDALDMTGFGKFNLLLMAVTWTVVVAMAAETSSVAYLVPASACELGTTSEQQGLMAGMPLFGILAASNIWGYLGDTRGRRKMIFVALVIGFITGCSATFATNWIVFCFLKFLSASAMAGTFGLVNTYMGECTPAAKRATIIVIVTSVYSFTLGIMAVLALPVISLSFSYYIPVLDIYFNPWRLLNIIYSLPCAFSAICMYFVIESPKFLLRVGKEKESLNIMKYMYAFNTGNDEDGFKASSIVLNEDNSSQIATGFLRSVMQQTIPLLKPPLLRNTLLLAIIYVAVYLTVIPLSVWTPFIVDGFMKSLERNEDNVTICEMLRQSRDVMLRPNEEVLEEQTNNCTMNHTAMMIVFITNTVMAALNLLMTTILSFVGGTKKMLFFLQVLAGLSALLVNLSSQWLLTALLLFVFSMAILSFGLLNTFGVNMFPTYVKAMGVCLTLMVGRGSAVFGIYLFKDLLTYNCEASFYVFGSISIVGAFFSIFLPSDKKKVPKKDEETTKN